MTCPTRCYVREYHQIDPRRQHALQLGAAGFGQWTHDHEVFDPSFVATDRFFQHYLPAYEIIARSMAMNESVDLSLLFFDSIAWHSAALMRPAAEEIGISSFSAVASSPLHPTGSNAQRGPMIAVAPRAVQVFDRR